MAFRFVRAQVGHRFVFSLMSTPVVLGEAEVDADGVLEVELTVPPGLHRVVVQNTETGATEFVRAISVKTPDECGPASDGARADVDGDGVANGEDNCPTVHNPGQATSAPDRTVGIVCDERLGEHVIDIYIKLSCLDGPFCSFYVPTIIADGSAVITGTEGDDTVFGGLGDDILDGGANSDRVFGGGGDDTIVGAGGQDVLRGFAGDDLISGGPGGDRIIGGDGNDNLNGGTGNDRIRDAPGDDVLLGAAGNDRLTDQIGRNHHDGGTGEDLCQTGDNDAMTNCES